MIALEFMLSLGLFSGLLAFLCLLEPLAAWLLRRLDW